MTGASIRRAGRGALSLAIALLLAAAPAAAGAKTLYSQIDKIPKKNPFGINSQDYETANDPADDQAADDFLVPAGKSWKVTEVDFDGGYTAVSSSASGSASGFNVYFYKDDGGLPGTSVSAQKHLKFGAAPHNAFVKLRKPVHLGAAHYWVSVQAVQNVTKHGEFVWLYRTTDTKHDEAAWQNPGDIFATGCTTWAIASGCIETKRTELGFALKGTAKQP